MNENGIYVPFIVDVEGGMSDVAERTEKELKRLMDKMSKHALSLRFDIQIDSEGEKRMMSVKNILTDATITSQHLEKVLKEITERIASMSDKGGFDLSKGLTEGEKDILQAFSVISQKYEGTGLLIKNITNDTKKWAEANAQSAQEVIEYWSKIDSMINTTGTSLNETTIRMRAAMLKLQATPAKLESGVENPEFTRLINIVKQAQAAIFEYKVLLGNVTDTTKENIDVLREQEKTISTLNMQMAEWKKLLENSEIGGDEFKEAAREMGILADETAKANFQFKLMSTQEDSISQISARISELNREWANAPKTDKYNVDGSLSDWAEGMVDRYNDLADLSEKYGKSLEQIASKRAELKAHEEALNNIGSTMDALNNSLSAWTRELNSAKIDSPEWQKAADHVNELRDKIQETADKLQEMGFKTGSINQMNASIQKLTNQWNNLGKRFDSNGKMTAEAKQIYDEYVKVVKQLEKEGRAMSDILSKQEEITKHVREQNKLWQRNQLVLNSEANTIDKLRARIELLTKKLANAKIGSTRFKEISAEIEMLNDKLSKTQGKAENMNGALRNGGTLLENLIRKSLYLFSLHTISNFAKSVRSVTAEFELQRVALGGIIQDTTRANQLFSEIKAAAIKSPFEIKDLVSYTKQLSAYRIETDKLFDVTMRLADVSAGLGVDMSRLVLAYGQVRSASVLRGQELRQFTEAGIPLVELLAKKFSELRGEMVSTGDVFELISERAVPFKMIEEIFNDMTNAGGIFFKMQEKQAETLAGQWANLKDAMSIMYDEMGNLSIINSLMKGMISLSRTLAKNWKTVADVVSAAAFSFISYKMAASKLIPVYDLQRNATRRQILLEKSRRADILKLVSGMRTLTKAEMDELAAKKALSAADVVQIYNLKKMNAAQLILFYRRNMNNKEIVNAIKKLKLLSAQEMSTIAGMKKLDVAFKVFNLSLKSAIRSIGTAIASFWPVALLSSAMTLIMDFITTSQEQIKAIREVEKSYHEEEQVIIKLENAYDRLRQSISDVTDEEKKAAKQAELFGQKLGIAQDIVENLKKFGVSGDFDLSLLNTDNIDEFVDTWFKQLNEANELTLDWGRNVEKVANAWQASVLGIHLAGDNLTTDINQLTNAYVKMTTDKKYRENLSSMQNYIEQLELNNKKQYDLLSNTLGEEAKLAVAQKRRNESEYQYQMRLIHNYEIIRQFAQSDQSLLSGVMASFKPMTDDLTKFELKLDEVEREFDKTWGSMEGKDEITIKMAIDKLFAEKEWDEWLKEAWIERVNNKYNMNIQVRPTFKEFSIPKGMKGIIATEFEGLFTEQELENMNSVTEIGKAIDDKISAAAESLKEADKLANNFANNDLWSEKTKEKIKKAQLTIDQELAKSSKDRNQEAIDSSLALIESLTKQNSIYEEQIQKKKEAARADYELAKSAKERLLNEGLSDIGKDIKQAFPGMMARNQIIDQMDLKAIGDAMKEAFPESSADLIARPLVDAAELVKKGWEDAGEGIATVFSSTFDFTDAEGKAHNLLVTPILPDGSVLSPEELEDYVAKILQSTDLKAADTSKLILGVDVTEDAGQRLHEMQEAYYDLAGKMKNVDNRFLISEDDLKNIKDGADAYEIYAKNVKAIADTREKLAQAGVSDATVSAEQARLDQERAETMQKLSSIESQIAEKNYEELSAQHDTLKLAVMNATTAEARRKAEEDLQDFLANTNNAEAATLLIEKDRLMTNLMITNAALGAQTAFANTFKVLDEAEQAWAEFAKRYNLTLLQKQKGGGAGQDPWIMLFKNRMKFMQDFQKGVEDMDKFLSHSVSLGREQEIMKGRGLSLGIKTEDLFGSQDELRDWYSDAIKQVVDKIRSMGGKEFAGLGVTEILAKDLTGRKIQKYQELLQELWKGLTDFDTNQLKKDMEDKIKSLSEEMKRSEAVRDFYKKMLDLTGDEELATSMSVAIYGGVGEDFKARMQKQLDEAFQSLDWNELPDDIWGQLAVAFSNQDFGTILENLDRFPEKWQEVLRKMSEDNEKYNASWVEDILKTYQKTKDYDERISDIHKREAQKRKEIEESDVFSPEKKAELTAASIRKENEDVASVQVEALKNTYEWGKAFEDLERVGNVTLVNLRKKIEEIIETQKAFLSPEQLKALTDALDKVRETQAKRDPTAVIGKAGQKLSLIAPALFSDKKSDTFRDAMVKLVEFNNLAEETDKIDLDHLQDEFMAIIDDLNDGINAVAEYAGQWKNVIDTLSDVFDIDEIPILGETVEGISDALGVVASILPVIISLVTMLSVAVNSIPFVAILTAIVAALGAIVGLIKGIINAKIEGLNDKIEEQSKLLDDLEYQYGRIEKAIEKSFGSDYIYNYTEQLRILEAEQKAYEEQARLEGEKGKKKDEEKIKDYEDAARDAMDKIADMKGQLAEFFSGTDLTSAASDFAQAWVDAYREFGSTTDAMSEKFQDMINSMINKSLAAKIMQDMLQPIFTQIDTLAEDGLLSTQDIADIASLAESRIPMINTAMTNLMSSLASAGLDVRNNTAGLSGISKNIANASEESILGLAAGINTQNFYMSYVPTISENVAQILTYISGGNATPEMNGGETVGEEMPSVQRMVYDHLPNIDQNIDSLLRAFKSVVVTKNGQNRIAVN